MPGKPLGDEGDVHVGGLLVRPHIHPAELSPVAVLADDPDFGQPASKSNGIDSSRNRVTTRPFGLRERKSGAAL